MSETNPSDQTGATPDQPATEPEINNEPKASMPAVDIPVEQIQPNPYQARRVFPEQEIQALADSIAETGLIQPIAVRKISDNVYQVIAGERRLMAFKLLNKTEIPCVLFDRTNADTAVMVITENISRKDLSDYEIAKAIRSVEALFPNRTRLAESFGLQREDMYRYLAYDALPAFIIEKLDVNPRLLSRNAAADIKHVFSTTPAEQQELAWTVCHDAIELLEAGKMEQGKIANSIIRKVKQLSENEAANGTRKETLVIDDQAIGHFSVSAKGIVILRFLAGVLSGEQAEELKNIVYNFVRQKLKPEQPQ